MKLRMYVAFLLLAVPVLFFVINLRILQLVMWIMKLFKLDSIKFDGGSKNYLRNQWLKLNKFQQLLQRLIANRFN